MANISSYPLKTPKSGDLILFTETYDANAANPVVGNPTKTATISSIASLANQIQLGYTSLVQLLTRTGNNVPIATEVYNNTGETFTWSYVSLGTYRITGTGAPFALGKTVVFVNEGNNTNSNVSWNRIGANIIEIVSLNYFSNGSFEVKIYN
jgi:hypothetical protein